MNLARTPLALLAASGAALAAPAAHAQCSWFLDDVPDFDQRRANPGGLPNEGRMYCVPTSMTDWMAYFANRGLPQPATLAGPRDWQSQTEYNRVNTAIDIMGTLMETDGQEGTDGDNGIDGLRAYLATFAFGDLTACRIGVWSEGAGLVNPASLLLMHAGGGYITACYGRYTQTNGGTRIGGHAIALSGVWDNSCGGTPPIMQFRDPAHVHDDPGHFSQSRFHTNMAVMTPITGMFRADGSDDFELRTLHRLDTESASFNYLDSYYCIFPAAGLIVDQNRAAQLDLVRPFRPTGNPAPALRTYNASTAAGVIKGVAFAADQLNYYYSADGNGTTASGVWRLNPQSGGSTRIVTLTGAVPIPAGPIAVSRLGDLYMIVGTSVHRYSLPGPSGAPIGTLDNISPAPQALAYDDKNDTVVVITSDPNIGPRRVYRWGRTLGGFGIIYDLLVTVDGVPCIQPDADTPGAYFVCGSDSNVLYRVAAQGSDLVQTHSILHTATSGLTGLNVTDANSLVYAVNGVLVEKEQNATGGWINRAGSRWAGRAAVSALAIARSRSNHQAGELGPTFNDLLDPTPYPFIPPCYANCDFSTTAPVLNVADFGCFLTKYAAGHVYANCDNSTTNPALNVADFGCYLTRYAQGCN